MSNDSRTVADVLVIGSGLIGLACAVAAAERGYDVLVVGVPRTGTASLAAAGLLAPSIEREDGHASDFGRAARDRYPAYVEWLRERTGVTVPLNRNGIIQVALNEAGARGLRRAMPRDAEWLDARTLTELEPALSHGLGGVLHRLDGCVDNVLLYEAIRAVADGHPRIATASDIVARAAFGANVVEVDGTSGTRYSADRMVLAAGAWSPTISGLPRTVPVEPVRGQMIAYSGCPIGRAVYGPTGYLVPRPDGRTLIGATSERAGFESTTTPDGITKLRRTAEEVLPYLAGVEPIDAWSGLRPMSADLQPILGVDPDQRRLIYATGHSRNGILMTPLTADCVVAILDGDSTPADISRFAITRFSTDS